MESIILNTKCGAIQGLDCGGYVKFLGVRYATAERFAYATPVKKWEGTYDATHHGDVCVQKRVWYAHLEIPERHFYHKEFREGQEFHYSEDCLNLNIYAPKEPGCYPVVVFIHGGGFDSGSNYDSAIEGAALAKKGVVYVSINYRVGVFGYFSHEAIEQTYGRDGNLGLDDQFTALTWIKENISDYYGDTDNITVMGQSAGAISIQFLCLSEKCKGLFSHAIMMSGAGLFPSFAQPKSVESTHEYWLDVMNTAGATSFEEFQQMDAKKIFDALEDVKARRKDNTYNTMPVIDGYHITKPVGELMEHPLPIDYMIGYTNNDMFAFLMSKIAHKYAKHTPSYLYYFDIDAPGGDNNGAFHSSDIRYVFGTLKNSHRPYDDKDEAVSEIMMDYIVQFAKTGNPNKPGLPRWEQSKSKALHIVHEPSQITMTRPGSLKLLHNMLTKGDPK
ncbi:MAG: carboxylesterase family protein [Lachnospiraceae bacterium]|nr:carboxylesterase family protein [Lachnospiraceae bacterium]